MGEPQEMTYTDPYKICSEDGQLHRDSEGDFWWFKE